MVKASLKSAYASLPPTVRATALVLGGDPKGKTFLHCSINGVVIRDVENPAENETYYEHQKTPTCAKYSHTGFYICSGDILGNVRIWDTTQKEHILKGEYRPLAGAITDIAWDADSKRIAVSGEGRDTFAHAFLWDSGSSVSKISGIQKKCNSVDIRRVRPYRCAFTSDDFVTYFCEGPPFKTSVQLREGTRFANCVRFTNDGKYFATSNSDGMIHLYDGKTAELIGHFGESKSHKGGVYSICFSPDDTELLSASADKTCKIWNVESREMLVEFVLGNSVDDQQLSCLWMNDYLLSVSLSGEINYLDRSNPSTPLRVVTGHNKSICAMAVKPQSAIYTASFDGRIVKWDPATGSGARFTGKGHGTKIPGMVYNCATNELISVGIDNKVRFTDGDSCEQTPDKVVPLDSEPFSVAISSEGDVVVACEKELVLIRDGKKASTFSWDISHQPLVAVQGTKIVVSGPPGTQAAVDEQSVVVYEIDGCNIVATGAKVALQKVTALALSSDGARLALANQKRILIYNLADGLEKEAVKFDGHGTACIGLCWSPNGQHLASISTDNFLFFWDVDNKAETRIGRSHQKGTVKNVAWLDDNTVVTAAEDCTVRQWSVTF